jgi:hypothetical protein
MIEMPKQKDLTRLVRSRMKKTGESYTAARLHIIRTESDRPASRLTLDDAARAGMSDAAIRAGSGKTWAQWVRVLDAIDATKMSHGDIAKYVRGEHGVGEWWAQGVTVGYERIRGLREKGQRRGGTYEASKSKTLPVTAEVAFDAFADARTRQKWLPVEVTVRKATRPKSVRMTWPDGTGVEVWIVAKGQKCSVGVQHTKLSSKTDQSARRTFWTEHLATLEGLLTR